MKKVFLDFTDEHSEVEPEYIELIKNDKPFYQDVYFFFGISADGQEYKLKTTDSLEPNFSPDITFKLKNEDKPLVIGEWGRIRKEQLLIKGTDWKPNEQQSIARLEELRIMPFKDIIIKPIQRKTWDIHNNLKDDPSIFYAMLIDSDRIIGRCTAEFIAPEKLDLYEVPEYLQQDKETEFIYISRVDIHPDYLGKRKCKPLVTFMIDSILSKLELKLESKFLFFIENASQTRAGIPACLCYTRAGRESKYKLNVFYPHSTEPRLEPISDDQCKIGGEKMPRTYYYTPTKPPAASSPKSASSSKKNIALGIDNGLRRRRRSKR